MLRISLLKVLIAGASGLLLACLASAGSVDSFTVYVGYADSDRPSGFFPTPWIGATHNGQPVISQTNPAGMTFDTSAIRIDNTGTTPIQISDFMVTFNNGAVLWNNWGPGVQLTLAPGQTGIFTQTVEYNFDGSDVGLFGSLPPANLEPNNADGNGNTNLIGGCSSNPSFFTAAQASGPCNISNAPVISFDENGKPVSLSDSGFILDTGQWDFVNNSAFGEDGNESINWNLIGGNSRGGSSTPEPGTFLPVAGPLACLGLMLRRRYCGGRNE